MSGGWIKGGNCFAAVRGVLVGEVLRLPALPKEGPATAASFDLGGADDIAGGGCDDERLRIVGPRGGESVYGLFEVVVAGDAGRFAGWGVAIRPHWSERYFDYAFGEFVDEEEVVALVNSEIFGVGLHWVRVSGYGGGSGEGAVAVCEIGLMFGGR